MQIVNDASDQVSQTFTKGEPRNPTQAFDPTKFDGKSCKAKWCQRIDRKLEGSFEI